MAAIHRRCISYVFTGLDSIAIDGFSDILLCVCIILMRKEDGRMFYWLLQSLKNWCERAYIPTYLTRYMRIQGQSRSRSKLIEYIFALEYKLFGIQKVLMKSIAGFCSLLWFFRLELSLNSGAKINRSSLRSSTFLGHNVTLLKNWAFANCSDIDWTPTHSSKRAKKRSAIN